MGGMGMDIKNSKMSYWTNLEQIMTWNGSPVHGIEDLMDMLTENITHPRDQLQGGTPQQLLHPSYAMHVAEYAHPAVGTPVHETAGATADGIAHAIVGTVDNPVGLIASLR